MSQDLIAKRLTSSEAKNLFESMPLNDFEVELSNFTHIFSLSSSSNELLAIAKLYDGANGNVFMPYLEVVSSQRNKGYSKILLKEMFNFYKGQALQTGYNISIATDGFTPDGTKYLSNSIDTIIKDYEPYVTTRYIGRA